jgi:DNA-binding response OmpR family regulator
MPHPPVPVPPVILVADSEPLYRWFAGELLRAAGYHVVLLERASDVRDYFSRQGPVSVVLVDLHLPDEDGRDLATDLHAMDARLPVLVLASDGGLHEPAAGASPGVPLVPKPADGEELLALVRETSALRT